MFKILFVDNDLETLRLWVPVLERSGYAVHPCSSASDANAVIATSLNSFDIAVIDLHLRTDVRGDASGLEVARMIGKRIPVIILTGGSDITSAARALREGVAATIVSKADGPQGLLEIIKAHLIYRVFIAHGHDKNLRDDVILCLKALGVSPVVLQDEPGTVTISELIDSYSDVSFAVILLTPDDLGGGNTKPMPVLRPRARQNVILEWGFFAARLGRGRVAVLSKEGSDGPLDLPSNAEGLRTISIDPLGKWRERLAQELARSGIPVDAAKVRI